MDRRTKKQQHGVTAYTLITLLVILTHFHGTNEAVVVYPISVLDIHIIHTVSTLRFDIHRQVTFRSTPFLHAWLRVTHSQS